MNFLQGSNTVKNTPTRTYICAGGEPFRVDLALSKQLTLGLLGISMPVFCFFSFHLDRWARLDRHVE